MNKCVNKWKNWFIHIMLNLSECDKWKYLVYYLYFFTKKCEIDILFSFGLQIQLILKMVNCSKTKQICLI